MPSLTIALDITPTSAFPTSASFTATTNFDYDTFVPTGTISIKVNGVVVAGPTAISGDSQSFGVALNNPADVGVYTVEAVYSGDSNWPGPVNSNTENFTVSAAVANAQAQVRPKYTTAAAAGALTREQIEDGETATEVYKVTAIAILNPGATRYDIYSTAVLVGGPDDTHEVLTVTLDDTGGIASIDGFDPDTEWGIPPKLTITRWDGAGPSANFLGY